LEEAAAVLMAGSGYLAQLCVHQVGVSIPPVVSAV